MDESKFFDTVKMNLELRADNLDSFSRVGSFPLSTLASIAMAVIVLGSMYALFPSLRSSVFGIFTANKSSATYSSVSTSEQSQESS